MIRKVMAVLLALVSLAASAHVGRAVIPGLRGPEQISHQVSWLAGVADSAADKMQRLFPEGEFFQWVLTGLAAGRLARDDVAREIHLEVLRRAVTETGRREIAARFGQHGALPHGVFYHGWRLLLLVEEAEVTEDQELLGRVRHEATAILAAFGVDPLPESYPGQAWPCDAVVALAAVHRAARIVDLADVPAATAAWFDAMRQHRDANGLLVHERGDDQARGSSQSIIQAFLPDIDPSRAAAEWPAFKDAFLATELGLVGVREYPHGSTGVGDVDSGPLVAGVSASASAVTLAAARRNGDIALATVLDREADLLGMPLPTLAGSAFAGGLLPVGDAFVAWARSVPLGEPLQTPAPQPWWWLWWFGALLPAVLGALLWPREPAH